MGGVKNGLRLSVGFNHGRARTMPRTDKPRLHLTALREHRRVSGEDRSNELHDVQAHAADQATKTRASSAVSDTTAVAALDVVAAGVGGGGGGASTVTTHATPLGSASPPPPCACKSIII